MSMAEGRVSSTSVTWKRLRSSDEAAGSGTAEALRSLFDAIEIGIAICELVRDREGTPTDYRILDVNDAFEALTGVPKTAAIGLLRSEISPIPDAELLRAIACAAESGRAQHFERLDESAERWLEVTVRPLGKGLFAETLTDITEAKLARERHEQLVALTDNNPSLIFLKDEDGRYVYLNRAYEERFATTGQWFGKTDYDFWPQESADLFRQNDRAVLASGRIHQFLEDSCDFDGMRFCWLNYKFPFTDAQGRRFVGGIGIDATAMVKADEALRESEERANEMIHHAPTGIYEIDFDPPRFTRVNKAMCELSGYSREELLGMNPLQILNEESRERFMQRIGEALKSNTPPDDVDYGAFRKDGTPLDVHLKVQFKRDEAGLVTGAFVIGHDVTERKRMERALAEGEARLGTLLDSLPVGVGVIDANGSLLLANGAMGRFLPSGVIPSLDDQRYGRWRSYHEDGTRIERADYPGQLALRGERVVPGVEYRFTDDEGRETWASVAAVPVRNDDGSIREVVTVVTDIDELKRTAEALEAELNSTRFLREIAAIAADTLEVGRLSERVLDACRDLLGASHGHVHLLDEQGKALHTAAAFGLPADVAPAFETIPTDLETATTVAYHQDRMVTHSDAEANEHIRRRELEAGFANSRWVSVPLKVRGVIIGCFALVFEGRRRFTDSEFALYDAIADQLGVGIANARMYESEHNIAETLQETLVVLPSHVPGISFSRAYESATYESGRVGGDFVDVFAINNHVVGITLGDVSGKGLDAAVTTSTIRTTLRVHAMDGLPPAQVTEKANMMMRRFTEIESFATLWFGLLDTRTGHLRYVSAGHPPALLLSPNGEVQQLASRDPILGAFDDASFHELQTVLGRGERLILYSDGTIEARSPSGSFLGEKGFLDVVSWHAEKGTSGLATAIMDEVVAYSEGVLRDDAAILAVEAVKLRSSRGDEGQLQAFTFDEV
jgi:PAS domain S-box-containing protein